MSKQTYKYKATVVLTTAYESFDGEKTFNANCTPVEVTIETTEPNLLEYMLNFKATNLIQEAQHNKETNVSY